MLKMFTENVHTKCRPKVFTETVFEMFPNVCKEIVHREKCSLIESSIIFVIHKSLLNCRMKNVHRKKFTNVHGEFFLMN